MRIAPSEVLVFFFDESEPVTVSSVEDAVLKDDCLVLGDAEGGGAILPLDALKYVRFTPYANKAQDAFDIDAKAA